MPSILLALAMAALGDLAATVDEPVDGGTADGYPGLALGWYRHGRTA